MPGFNPSPFAFWFGEGDPFNPDTLPTGIGASYPGIVYNDVTFYLYTFDLGVLTWGVTVLNGKLVAGGINGSTGFPNVELHSTGINIQAGIEQANEVGWYVGDPSDLANLLGKISGFIGAVGGGSQMTINLTTGEMAGKDAIINIRADVAADQYGIVNLIGKDTSGNSVTLSVNGSTKQLTFMGNSVASAILGCGNIGQLSVGLTRYFHPMAGDTGNATENQVSLPSPFAGTIRNLHVFLSSAQPASGSLTVAVRKGTDGAMADTALTKVIAASAAAGVYSNTTDTDTITQGELISVKITNGAPVAFSANIRGISFEISKS